MSDKPYIAGHPVKLKNYDDYYPVHGLGITLFATSETDAREAANVLNEHHVIDERIEKLEAQIRECKRQILISDMTIAKLKKLTEQVAA